MDLLLGVEGVFSLWVLMIETPHTVQTHGRSTLYIYKVLSVEAPATVASGHMDAIPA